MKIAIMADTHLGYLRFEEDAFVQAERALLDASHKADVILFAGDLFDVKVPKLETLNRAMGIFRKAKLPVYAIHGNHERRTRDVVNPLKLMETGGVLHYLHNRAAEFSVDGEKLQVFGLGSVPEDFAEAALKKAMERFVPDAGAFRVLVIHQSIKELIPFAGKELSLECLEPLPFDLIVNGHIHKTISRLDGRMLIPGSTVITQLKKDETEPKGYFLYDTVSRKAEFVPIECRKFFYEELEFKDSTGIEVNGVVGQKVEEIRKAEPNSVIAIKIDGTLKPGLSSSDVLLDGHPNVFLDNRLNSESLGMKLDEIKRRRQESLSARDLAVSELEKKLDGKITMFSGAELFEKLVEGPEEAMEYLEKNRKVGQAGAT